jgi:hypothetical protein
MHPKTQSTFDAVSTRLMAAVVSAWHAGIVSFRRTLTWLMECVAAQQEANHFDSNRLRSPARSNCGFFCSPPARHIRSDELGGLKLRIAVASTMVQERAPNDDGYPAHWTLPSSLQRN